MTPDHKGAWMRRLIIFVLVGAAAAGGYVFMPKGKKDGPRVASTAVKVTFDNHKEVYAKPGVLTVVNMRLEGNSASDKLQETLERLKRDKYGAKIQLAEVDVAVEKALAGLSGVDKDKLAGHLEFYSESKQMSKLVGQTDPKVVEETIDRILGDMFQRMGKDWMPEVEGMTIGGGTGVPGMSRERGSKQQLPPSFKPATAPKKDNKEAVAPKPKEATVKP